jgi:hypothetical protein
MCHSNQTPITLIWEKTPELNCDFNQLFELPGTVRIVNRKGFQSRYLNRSYKIVRKAFRIVGLYLPIGYKNYYLSERIKQLKQQQFDFTEITTLSSVFMESEDRFFSVNRDFADFTPIDSIRSRVRKITDTFGPHTIGVHIRRTDNYKSAEMSPLELFIQFMDEEIVANKEVSFFLATDSPEVEQTLYDRYKGKIIIQPNKRLSRKDPEAIQDALVDILCLSKTKKVFGSYWSSFSETAALIGKIELVVVTKNNST